MMISLDLKDMTVLVIGSSYEAVSRSETLCLEGARVTLVSTSNPDLGAQLKGVNFCYQRRLRVRNLKGIFLVIATDRNRAINEWLFKKSRRFGFLLNTLDEKPTSNFYHVAVRRVDPRIEIAVSTKGASPAFASRLSTRLANQVGIEDIAVLDTFISTRRLLKSTGRSTFGFDWTGLENRVRHRRLTETGSAHPSLQQEQVPSFGRAFAASVQPDDNETLHIAPFTDNFLDNRSAGSRSNS